MNLPKNESVVSAWCGLSGVAKFLLLLMVLVTIWGCQAKHTFGHDTVVSLTAIVALGVGSRRKFSATLPLIAGLVFSILGDGYMTGGLPPGENFLVGLVFYAAAHIAYMIYFIRLGGGGWRRWEKGLAAMIFVAYGVYFFAAMVPSLQKAAANMSQDVTLLGVSCFIYLALSVVCFVLTFHARTSPGIRMFFVGGIGLILLSDTLIAENIFCGRSASAWLIIPTYLVAHCCLAWGGTLVAPE